MTALKHASAIVTVLGLGALATAPAHGADTGSVSLVVDYSNGARTTFARLPFEEGMTAFETLVRASEAAPGLVVEVVRPDRGGDVSVVLDCTSDAWSFWIDEWRIGARLRAHGDPSGQEVRPGDVVLAKVTDGAVARSAPSGGATVALVVDYSNGTQKTFAGLPWRQEMDVLKLLLAAAASKPGLEVDFGVFPNPNSPDMPMVDRAGREIGALRAIDGVAGEGHAWRMWIDGRDLGVELRAGSRFSGGLPRVAPGDIVLLKRVADEDAHSGPWHDPTSAGSLEPAAGPACQ